MPCRSRAPGPAVPFDCAGRARYQSRGRAEPARLRSEGPLAIISASMSRDRHPVRGQPRPLGPILLGLRACGGGGPACGESGEATFSLDGYEVQVPEGWTAHPSVDGPRRILTLRDGDRAVFCQIIVLRDGRVFHDDDAVAFVGDAKASFEVTAERPATLDTAEGPMRGFVTGEADLPRSWGVSTLAGEPLLEMYAATRVRRLVAAIAATSTGHPGAEDRLGRCREVIRSMAAP
jgi:hypothetical protein